MKLYQIMSKYKYRLLLKLYWRIGEIQVQVRIESIPEIWREVQNRIETIPEIWGNTSTGLD